MRPPLFFWFFNSPSPATQGPMDPTGGGGTSADIVPTQIIFGADPCTVAEISLKMQKFPIDSHSNGNFICLFFRPPGAANPQTTSFPSTRFALPWAKISRRSHHPTLRYPEPYKQTNKQTKRKLNITPNATLYGKITSKEAQLSQRCRATLHVVGNCVNSLKINQNHSKSYCWVGRVLVPFSIQL